MKIIIPTRTPNVSPTMNLKGSIKSNCLKLKLDKWKELKRELKIDAKKPIKISFLQFILLEALKLNFLIDLKQ